MLLSYTEVGNAGSSYKLFPYRYFLSFFFLVDIHYIPYKTTAKHLFITKISALKALVSYPVGTFSCGLVLLTHAAGVLSRPTSTAVALPHASTEKGCGWGDLPADITLDSQSSAQLIPEAKNRAVGRNPEFAAECR